MSEGSEAEGPQRNRWKVGLVVRGLGARRPARTRTYRGLVCDVYRMAHVERDARVGAVLDAAAEFFREYRWTSGIGVFVLERIARDGVERETDRVDLNARVEVLKRV
jgi:hypothetical protein